MKSLNIFLTIMILALSRISALAFDWKGANISVIESKKESDTPGAPPKTIDTLKDQSGNIFSVTYLDELADQKGKRIIELNEKFLTWKNLKIQFIRYIVSEDTIEIIIAPSKFEYKNTDFMPYMPAGMFFILTDTLTYNFRMNVKSVFIKIKGEFLNEDLVCGKMLEAVKNPSAYVRKRDPEYFLRKLEQFENEIEKIKNDSDNTRHSIMTLHNKGFFGGVNLIKKELISRVVEMKKQNPKLSKEQILEKLKQDKIEASAGEIELILNVHFNEFKQ